MDAPDVRATDGLHRVRPDVDGLRLLMHAALCGGCRELGPHGAHIALTFTQTYATDDPRVVAAFRQYAPSTTTYRLGLHREGVPTTDPWRASPEHAAGLPVPEAARDPQRDLTHLIAHAERLGIVLDWGATAPEIGGFVSLLPSTEVRRRDPSVPPPGIDPRTLAALAHGEVVLFLNADRPTPEHTARTLLHELAHVLLGHLLPYLRAPQRAAVPARFTLPTPVIEIEAILASYAAARRRGYAGTPHFTLAHWLRQAQANGVLELVDLMRVFEVAERLVAWCRAGPERDAVRATARPRTPRPPAGATVLGSYPRPAPDVRPDPLARRVPELEPA
ncbi:MAG: hypothetical protein ABR510_05415 [Trueperaceae bacterium]